MKTSLTTFRPKNSLTKREFILIALLLVVIEGYLLFTYILQPTYNEYISQKTGFDSAKKILVDLKADFAKKSEMENKLAEIDAKINELALQIPPYLSQEEVILLVDGFSKKDQLSVQLINFDNAGALPSVAATSTGTQENITTATTDTTASGDPSTNQTAEPVSTTLSLVSQDISLSFSGTYSQIYSFLSDMEENLRKVKVKGITLQRSKGDLLTGQVRLSFVSYWDAQGKQPYTLEVAPIPGKNSPFVPYSGYSESATKGTVIARVQVQPVFYLLLNSYLDNAAKVIMTQYSKEDSAVAIDVNEPVNASLKLNRSNGAFTYEYVVGSQKKSGQKAIEAQDGKIRMQVVAQARKSDQDKVAVTLDVNNNSGIPFEITVKGDNKQNPRFRLGKTTGSVIVK